MEEKNNEMLNGPDLPRVEPTGDAGLDQNQEYTRPQQQYISPVQDVQPSDAQMLTPETSVCQVQTLFQMEEQTQARQRRRRRRNTVILLVALAVFVFISTVSGFVFVKRYFAEHVPDRPGASSSQSQSQPSDPPTTKPGPGVENGPTVYLEDKPNASTPQMTIADIYQKLSPSVVMILASDRSSMALGTGIIMSQDGFIITNAHIIEGASEIQIVLNDNTTSYKAQIMGSDTASDIAVLKIEATGLIPATFGDSDQVVIGEGVVTIGNPYSTEYAQTVTDGIISGIRRNLYSGNVSTDLLQTNAQLNPGNSGGPLINMYGQVIGINSSKIMSSGSATYEGLGFAIPMTDAKEIIDELIRYGYITPDPVIGVTVSFISQDAAIAEDMVSGCMVMSIEQDSDAYKQGLRVGDIITQINGKEFDDLDGFIDEKNRYQAGDTVQLKCWRMGEYYSIQVTLMSGS